MRGDAQHRHALGLHARDLAEAERVGARRARHRHRRHEAGLARSRPGEELLERHLLRAAVGALHRYRCVERQQRRGKVAVGRRRKQVAAHGRHRPHRRSADDARRRMQEGEVAVGEDVDHAHAGADLDARALGADLAVGGIRGAHQHGDRRIALVDGAHQQRAAGDEARGPVGGQRRGRLAHRPEGFHLQRHRCLMPPAPRDGGSPRTPPRRSARRPSWPSRPRGRPAW